MNQFREIFEGNYENLIAACKKFAQALQGTAYEFLLDAINPALFNPSDIVTEQINEVIDALFRAPGSGRLMNKMDRTGFMNHDIMFFNPLNNIFDAISSEHLKHINEIRETRKLAFLNGFLNNSTIEIDDQNFFNEKYFDANAETDFWNDGGPKYSAANVSNFIRQVIINTFQPEYTLDELNSSVLKTIVKKKVKEKLFLGLQFDITPYKFKYNLNGEMRFPDCIELFYTESEHKLLPENTVFLGAYRNPCFHLHNLNVFLAISRSFVFENNKFERRTNSSESAFGLNWHDQSRAAMEHNKSIYMDLDNKIKHYAHAYFHLLKFSAQPYGAYIEDCIRKI